MKIKTEVIQDKLDYELVMIKVITMVDEKLSNSTSIRVPKDKISTLIKQLKAWK